jgi:hypothetical protein
MAARDQERVDAVLGQVDARVGVVRAGQERTY